MHNKHGTIVPKIPEYDPYELKEQKLSSYIRRKVEQIGYHLIENLKEFALKKLRKRLLKTK